jgi:hypothetical protein
MQAFEHVAKGPVTRYKLTRLHAFNFIIENALAATSRRID